MGVPGEMPGQVVLVLILIFGAATTALTESKVELLKTALNAPTNSAILEVALTHSTPELLKIALRDATVENLIVALTAADGSAVAASGQSASAKLKISKVT